MEKNTDYGELMDKSDEYMEQEIRRREKRRKLISKLRASKIVDREIHSLQTNVRELIIYLFFLAIVSIVSLGIRNINMFYLTNIIRDTFIHKSLLTETVHFSDVHKHTHFWEYFAIAFPDVIFWRPIYEPEGEEDYPEDDDLPGVSLPAATDIFYENKVLGDIRMRQVRVMNNSCVVYLRMRDLFKNCYGYYTMENEDKNPFGPGSGTPWVYSTASEIGDVAFVGAMGTYGGGGYYVDLPAHNEEQFKEIKENLLSDLWTDKATRAVFIDFTIHNSGLNLFCAIKLVFEFLPTGGVIPSSYFRTAYLVRYTTPLEFFILGTEILLAFFLLYYTIILLQVFRRDKLSFFRNLWNLSDTVMITLFYSYLMFVVYCYFEVNRLVSIVSLVDHEYINFNHISFLYARFESVKSVALFIAWIRLMKFVNINRTMYLIGLTVLESQTDLAVFLVTFLILFYAYSQLAFVLFGNFVEKYSSISSSLFSLHNTFLGDFEFEEIRKVNRFLGQIYYLAHIFMVFFVLLNMFLAIINDTYGDVLHKVSTRPEFYINDLLKRGTHKVKEAVKSDENESVSVEDFKKILQEADIPEIEIAVFLMKYNIDLCTLIEAIDELKLMAELAERKATPDRNVPVIRQEYKDLVDKIQRIETAISSSTSRIDIILNKMNELVPKKRLWKQN